MKHLGWLRAIPESRSAKSKTQHRSRWTSYVDANKKAPPMPEVASYKYLLGYLDDLGHAESTGNGLKAISYQEIKAWQELTSIDLTSWEALTIHDLSTSYIVGYNSGRSLNSPPYWQPMNFDKKQVAKGIRSMFSSLNNNLKSKR